MTECAQNNSAQILPRDDHVMSDLSDGSFLVFGGFVNGSRVNELAKFTLAGQQTITSELLADGATTKPIARAASSSAVYQDKLYVFGG